LLIDARHFGQPFVDGVYWTIVYEVQFYAMVAGGLAVPWLRRHATACLALWLLLSMLNAFVLRKSAFAHLLISNFSGLFIAGMMLYRFHRRRFSPVNIALFIAALAFALAMELQMADGRFVPLRTAWSPWVVCTILLVPIALLSLTLRRRFAPQTERALQRIGALTYPLYLLHATMGYVLIDRLAPRIGAAAAIALTVLTMLLLAAWVAAWIEPRLKAFIIARVRPPSKGPHNLDASEHESTYRNAEILNGQPVGR
jgi:peptidoglycan/LPS O-acetylase OafA/YrhL